MDQLNDMSSLSESPRRVQQVAQSAGQRRTGTELTRLEPFINQPATQSTGFKDIPVGQKLALIALSLLLPMGLLLYFATSRIQQDIDFAKKERVGLEYLLPLKNMQNQLQEYRAQLTNFNQDVEGSQAKIIAATTSIEAAITELGVIDQSNQDALNVSTDISLLLEQWNDVKAKVDLNNINMIEITPAVQGFIENSLAPLVVKIGDNSNLTLDPSVESYYLQNMLINEITTGVPRIGALRTIGRNAIGDGVITEQERVALATTYLSAEDAARRIFNSLERAKTASPFVAAQVAETESTARTAVDTLLTTYGNEIVNAAQPTITFEEASQVPAPRAPMYALYDVAHATLDDVLEQRIQNLQRQNLLTLLGVAASLLLSVAVIYFITQQITRPLRELNDVSNSLAQGDLSRTANVESRDEIGTLASSFNNAIVQLRDANARQDIELQRSQQLQNNIGEFLNVAMDIAQGDFTKRGQVSEDALGNVVDAINFMTEELGYVLKDVQNATESVTQGATDMFGTADSIARSAQAQAQEAQKAREDVQDIRSTMRQVSDEMNLSAESANKALVASKEGRQAVVQTLSGMQDIRREVQAVSKRVKNLGDRSLEISEIVETISRISEQTNLLAVNAAIESSGAGEAGLRFAVVADQVRKLAEESAYAAERVSILIKTVQDEVQEVITGVEAGTREVEEGYRVASQAGQRLEDIASIVEKSASLAQRISQATQEQVSRVEQVGQVVEQMAEISAESRETVTKGREAAERLQQLAAQLSDNLSRFRLA
jgi:twitching motility protein PilJ